MTPDDAFLQAIIASPDDLAPRLAYADWLADHGQIGWAAYLRVQCRLACLAPAGPGRAELQQREADLLAVCARSLVGPRLRRYVEAEGPDPSGLRPQADRLAVLPLFLQWDDFLGIRLDGRVVRVDWDPPYAAHDASPLDRNLALYQGGVKYPEFRLLLPPRPCGSRPCTSCGGTGRFDLSGPAANVICSCGGLGWLPPDG